MLVTIALIIIILKILFSENKDKTIIIGIVDDDDA